MYVGTPDETRMREWFDRAFLPFLDQVKVEAISWEKLFDRVARCKPDAARFLGAFYEQCLRYNPTVTGAGAAEPRVAAAGAAPRR